MATQTILANPARAAIFLVLTVDEGADPAAVRDLLAQVSGLTRSVAFRVPDDELLCVVGIGSRLWDRIFPGVVKPRALHPFEALHGDRHTAPSTPGDLLIHLRSRELAMCFELAGIITTRARGLATVVDEVHGFRFFDERDLLGFVDGTENPEGAAAGLAVTISPEADPAYAGGSYVIVQKYLHDMAAWDATPVAEQERVIGRSKLEDLEMSDEVKPRNSHIALNVIEDDNGVQLQIMRDNMPFGHVGNGEYGTYFIGYSADPSVTERMLRNMFIGDPVGNTDRILDFSTAVTGSLYFVPTIDFLDAPPAPVTPAVQSGTVDQPSELDRPGGAVTGDAPERDPDDGTLGIGSLRDL